MITANKNSCLISYTMILLLQPENDSCIPNHAFFYRKNYTGSIVNNIIWHSPI